MLNKCVDLNYLNNVYVCLRKKMVVLNKVLYFYVGENCDIELCKENYCRYDGDCYIVGDINVCVCIFGWMGNRC